MEKGVVYKSTRQRNAAHSLEGPTVFGCSYESKISFAVQRWGENK